MKFESIAALKPETIMDKKIERLINYNNLLMSIVWLSSRYLSISVIKGRDDIIFEFSANGIFRG
jgi:hypothetical protein